MPLNVSELGLNFRSISNLYWVVFLQIACIVSIPWMLEKNCSGNPISTFPPCYAFPCNVHNKFRALKQLCNDSDDNFYDVDSDDNDDNVGSDDSDAPLTS